MNDLGPVEIIIPSMDNRAYLEPCLRSIRRWTLGINYRVTLVNNGRYGSCSWVGDYGLRVVECETNRGWVGGLQEGLDNTDGERVLFLNDDTLIPPASGHWLATMTTDLAINGVGAVGPCSNCVAGGQSMYWIDGPSSYTAPFLIGFCLLTTRSALSAAGGLDPTLPGGDDLDLSIRLQDAGYRLIAERGAFVFHHGFVTGRRVYGPETRPFGWNSPEYSQTVLDALVAKHGRERIARIGWIG